MKVSRLWSRSWHEISSRLGISPRGVAALRQQGHDALHLQEQDLGDMPDPEILAKARAEGRILLTFDLDFG